ncbi:MAG: transglycosylase [Devosia sp.]
MSPILTLLVILLIGIIVGIASLRLAKPGWLSQKIAGGRRAEVTSALVGIAGAFTGFHIAALIGLGGGEIVLLVGAALGAALLVWVWREVKF